MPCLAICTADFVIKKHLKSPKAIIVGHLPTRAKVQPTHLIAQSIQARLTHVQSAACLQALPKSLDPDSVLEAAWAQAGHSGGWGLPEGLDPSLEAFRTWLRHLLWELTLLLVQVSCRYLPFILDWDGRTYAAHWTLQR